MSTTDTGEAIVRELQETNRLLTALLKLKVPVHPTVEELGLVPGEGEGPAWRSWER